MQTIIKKSGFLLINKPVGPTSFGVIAKLRKITGIKKIGHAGTLDPFASGVLVVAIGREATRLISQYVKLDKEYEAVLHLGAVTDTFDRTGKLEVRSEKLEMDRFDIENVLIKYTGKQKQTPPMFSAKKVGGKKLYELARKGIEIERKAVEINIYELELLEYNYPLLKIRVKCSSGTYIRSLAHDIGQNLGCGAYLTELKRTAVGVFGIEECCELADIQEDDWGSVLFSA
ncbi:MAG: tRNA pseudouridine synthase B [Candidatus Falkowbacteria bacterium GW2011_GWC2_38_22]|uniref:tRNA pseudouridine synthase B n=1 Tax=Candidatus Falkowbacteria bacterium GW2011_GWE1_38_31 TaxID=1618638 RepID=A0A0G0MZG9_9BACT|nr:MAG: tRNA pseudouridine synthase B [Candidatus Falkowbacteria bacterium GW2011_GWF2_38_1205]KKQ60999.1 MAG: tRNA pseudouridine synthase B [Candidatus Falkowbacteria bacterium GW2011_GWC2_38_22]KKQ63472.1 MAG: tRNA pseudouridine synthase B [Candidatus Falkowbacteria bacterium GW2011_GWF1_38_22]KKQ65457.1 MAG: tRNA pseudouridine synthase B [Candidatus Falkowbacteria bacterium GW2011_GWE2_38_254]KKQ70236.1 MAG: tRNA pseudouridine synthase B [Candidatus Falkowbacteria bacterium GW2011_GWE1_38_31